MGLDTAQNRASKVPPSHPQCQINIHAHFFRCQRGRASGLRALLRHAVAAREVAGLGQGHPEVRVPTAVRVHERVGGLCMATKDTSE